MSDAFRLTTPLDVSRSATALAADKEMPVATDRNYKWNPVADTATWRLQGLVETARKEISKVESYARIDDPSQRLVYAGMLDALYELIGMFEEAATLLRGISYTHSDELIQKAWQILQRLETRLADGLKSYDRLGDKHASGKYTQYQTFVRYFGYALSELKGIWGIP
jgi:hypothetical protein